LSLGSFSAKVESALTEWFAMKSLLVQYRDETQIQEGKPVILNEFAARIYSCSQFQNGWSFKNTPYSKVVEDCLNSLDRANNSPVHSWITRQQKWVAEIAVPAFRRIGLVVQCIDQIEYDLFDVWVCDSIRGTAGDNCGDCPVVKEIWEYLDQVKKRRKI
jgi:hypothetical protein